MNTEQAEEAYNALVYPKYSDYGAKRKDEWKQAKVEYAEDERRIRRSWGEWLKDTYAFDFPETVQEEIYDRAWSSGHHAGYRQVEFDFEELAQFATIVAEAIKE